MDRVSKEQRSAIMSRIRSKSTKPEMAVRSAVHRMGYRYRLHRHDLPGRPDLVFPSRRKVIFVHGCFWHQHRNCKKAHEPESNRGYWQPKLERNKRRDASNRAKLTRMGWRSLVVWECQVHADLPKVAARIKRFLDSE